MSNYFRDNDDLAFYLDAGADWPSIVEASEYGFRARDGFHDTNEAKAFYREMLEDPKRDFSLAMLHAEKLAQLPAVEAVAEVLLDEARRDPARRIWLESWLERAEPRSRALTDTITTTGGRVLASLGTAQQRTPTARSAAE